MKAHTKGAGLYDKNASQQPHKEATFRHLSTLSFKEGLINCSQGTVGFVDYQEEVVVVAVAINRHGLSRGGADEHVDVIAIVGLGIQLGLNVGGHAVHIVQLNGGGSNAIQDVEFSSGGGHTIEDVELSCGRSNTVKDVDLCSGSSHTVKDVEFSCGSGDAIQQVDLSSSCGNTVKDVEFSSRAGNTVKQVQFSCGRGNFSSILIDGIDVCSTKGQQVGCRVVGDTTIGVDGFSSCGAVVVSNKGDVVRGVRIASDGLGAVSNSRTSGSSFSSGLQILQSVLDVCTIRDGGAGEGSQSGCILSNTRQGDEVINVAVDFSNDSRSSLGFKAVSSS